MKYLEQGSLLGPYDYPSLAVVYSPFKISEYGLGFIRVTETVNIGFWDVDDRNIGPC